MPISAKCMYMLLGLETDLFQLRGKEVVIVDSARLESVFCAHISNGALRSVLKRFAQSGTLVLQLRNKVRDCKHRHEKLCVFIEKEGGEVLIRIDRWIQDRLAGHESSLISILANLRSFHGEVRTLLEWAENMESDALTRIWHQAYLSTPNEFEAKLKSHHSSFFEETELTESANFEPAWIIPFDAVNPQAYRSPPTPGRDAQLMAKTYFICYVWENRIISH